MISKEYKKYLFVLFITIGIFVVVFGFTNFVNNKKLANIDDLQRKITADLIATETQFDLLTTAPCSALGKSVLSSELEEFGRKLDYAQENQGPDDTDVIQLKKYYSLLQVKDYLLMQELADKCDSEIHFLLYFYNEDCDDCRKQGYVLTDFKKEYPELRIYSFDGSMDYSVINTFSSLYDFEGVYPSIIVNGQVYQGFINHDTLVDLFPELVANKEAYDIQEKGKAFILSQEGYAVYKNMSLMFKADSNDIYTYEVIGDDQKVIQVIEIEYDIETNSFNLVDDEVNEKTNN